MAVGESVAGRGNARLIEPVFSPDPGHLCVGHAATLDAELAETHEEIGDCLDKKVTVKTGKKDGKDKPVATKKLGKTDKPAD